MVRRRVVGDITHGYCRFFILSNLYTKSRKSKYYIHFDLSNLIRINKTFDKPSKILLAIPLF
jgi:hypothetical protein